MWELKAEVRWRPDEPPGDVYISGVIGQRVEKTEERCHPEDLLDVSEGTEAMDSRTELSDEEARRALRNISEGANEGGLLEWLNRSMEVGANGTMEVGIRQRGSEGSLEGNLWSNREPPKGNGPPKEGVASVGLLGSSWSPLGEDSAPEVDGLPRYVQMRDYVDNLVKEQSMENRGRLPESEGRDGLREESSLGYNITRVEEKNPNEDPIRGILMGMEEVEPEEAENALDWTVYDRRELSMDYNLGEIANRSFADRYGIWAGQEEIFPEWPHEARESASGKARQEHSAALDRIRGGVVNEGPDVESGTRAADGEVRAIIFGGFRGETPGSQKELSEERAREHESWLEELRELDVDSTPFEEGMHEGVAGDCEGKEVGWMTSTQMEGQSGSQPFGGGERAISPIGNHRGRLPGAPRFIDGLFQDEDLRLEVVLKKGGLTFGHSIEGDIDLIAYEEGTNIPPRYPPMSDSTVDWSLIRGPGPGEGPGKKGKQERGTKEMSRAGKADAQGGGQESTALEPCEEAGMAALLGKTGITLRKGRYSRKRKGHRGGRNKRRKQGFLSEEDFEETLVHGIAEASDSLGGLVGREVNSGPGKAPLVDRAKRGVVAAPGCGEEDTGEVEDEVTKEDEVSEENGTNEEAVENAVDEPTRKTRRRKNVVTVEDGRILIGSSESACRRTAPAKMVVVWPRRKGIITQDMADPNRNIVGYRSQEVPVVNARTSGVFWNASKTRDNRRFPGSTGKTLLRQSLESVPEGGTGAGGEGVDPLRWPGVRPPEVGPR